MITLATKDDTTNDIYIDDKGNIATSENIYALANVSKNAVLTNLGEAEYNTDNGIPYFDTIFCDTPKIDLFQASIVQTLENLENVQRVSNFEYSVENGVFKYSLIEKTKLGDIVLNG